MFYKNFTNMGKSCRSIAEARRRKICKAEIVCPLAIDCTQNDDSERSLWENQAINTLVCVRAIGHAVPNIIAIVRKDGQGAICGPFGPLPL